MPTRVRSYSKINLGLAIGAPRPDGFHGLATLYQTLALHDVVTVSARRAERTTLSLRSNDIRVPCDQRNTAWKMVEKSLKALGLCAEVEVHIQKNLPVQGGMGAGSANAAAALIGLERELGLAIAGRRAAADCGRGGVGCAAVSGWRGGAGLRPRAGGGGGCGCDARGRGGDRLLMALPAVGVSTPAGISGLGRGCWRSKLPRICTMPSNPRYDRKVEPHLCFRPSAGHEPVRRLRYLSRSESSFPKRHTP